jgi:hypothetical protein
MATSPYLRQKFLKAMTMLVHPLGELQEHRPDCLAASAMFPWSTVVARKFGIPRLSFHATSFLSICTSECLRLHEPHKNISSDSEPFIIPNFPDEINLKSKQPPDLFTQNVDAGFMEFYKQVI